MATYLEAFLKGKQVKIRRLGLAFVAEYVHTVFMDIKKHGSTFFDLWMLSDLPAMLSPAQGHLLSDHHILLLVNHCNK